MRRFTIFILVACSSFAAGIIVSRYFRSNDLSLTVSLADPPAPKVKPSVYENDGRTYFRGVAGLATRGSFITLVSSDGMHFTKWTVSCRSAEAAAIKLKKAIRKAVKIVSREPNCGDNAEEVGEKIVALFGNGRASLLWTENDEFFEVEGASLHEILEYRKDFHR